MLFNNPIILSVSTTCNDDSSKKRYLKIENSMFNKRDKPFRDGNVKEADVGVVGYHAKLSGECMCRRVPAYDPKWLPDYSTDCRFVYKNKSCFLSPLAFKLCRLF